MNPLSRRKFLGFLGAGAAGVAATPLLGLAEKVNRVYSFPSKIVLAQPATVRFVRAWDPFSDRMVYRLDVLYGFPDLIGPKFGAEQYEAITVNDDRRVAGAIEQMQSRHLPVDKHAPLRLFEKQGNEHQIRGINWVDHV